MNDCLRLRAAVLDDVSFLVQREGRFGNFGVVAKDSAAVYKQQMANPDCRYYIVEADGQSAGYVILWGLMSINRCVELCVS